MSSPSNNVYGGFFLFLVAVALGGAAAVQWPEGMAIDGNGGQWHQLAAWAFGSHRGREQEDQSSGPEQSLLPPQVELPSADPFPLRAEVPTGYSARNASTAAGAPKARRPWLIDPAAPAPKPRYTPSTDAAFWPTESRSESPLVRMASARKNDAQPGRLQELLVRVEQLGAVVVRLQRHPEDARLHLFRCEFPLGSGSPYRRFFQAADAEPVRAVERVLKEVEAWRK